MTKYHKSANPQIPEEFNELSEIINEKYSDIGDFRLEYGNKHESISGEFDFTKEYFESDSFDSEVYFVVEDIREMVNSYIKDNPDSVIADLNYEKYLFFGYRIYVEHMEGVASIRSDSNGFLTAYTPSKGCDIEYLIEHGQDITELRLEVDLADGEEAARDYIEYLIESFENILQVRVEFVCSDDSLTIEEVWAIQDELPKEIMDDRKNENKKFVVVY